MVPDEMSSAIVWTHWAQHATALVLQSGIGVIASYAFDSGKSLQLYEKLLDSIKVDIRRVKRAGGIHLVIGMEREG